ncbi:DUF7151 family protein [Myxococcus hansupus]|nr:hypothetical protein [Myxococcus hansupus]
MRRMWMAVCVLAMGCDGISLDQLIRQHPPLTRLESEPGGANCALGGHAVHTGLDVNDNGLLEPDEVTATTYACTTSVPGVLLSVRDEPPGGNCPEGGKAYRAGHDLNRNDALEDSEVTSEAYGCVSSEAVLTRIREQEPRVFPCHEGGSRVEAGQDVNGNGELDDSEVRATTILCVSNDAVRVRLYPAAPNLACPTPNTQVDVGTDINQDGVLSTNEVADTLFVCQPLHTLMGNHHVRSAVDLAVLGGISRIRGSLTFSTESLQQAVLPDLMQVEGALEVLDTSLTRVELPALRFVGHSLTVARNPVLQTLTLGSGNLAPLWVQGQFDLVSNPVLPTLAGVAAVAPRSSILIKGNANLDGGYFAYIAEHLASITLEDNAKLSTIPFRNLQWLGGSLTLARNSRMGNLTGTVLQQVGGDLIVQDNEALSTLSGMPELASIGGTFSVRANANLRSTEGLSALAQVGIFEIDGNPVLESVEAFPELKRITHGIRINGNARLHGLWQFKGLQHLGFLLVRNNPALARLQGFGFVQTMTTLNLENNASLTDLSDFSSLRTVEELNVLSHERLVRLDLHRLEVVTRSFAVTENTSLPNCLAVSLAARVVQGFSAEIHGNDTTATCD